MRFYKKEHTIKMLLTGLFPCKIEDEDLLLQNKEYYLEEGLDSSAEEEKLEKIQEERFLKHKNLLLKYVPDNLRRYIESDSIFPIKNLSNQVLLHFDSWSQSINNEVKNVFEQYDKYIKSIMPLLPDGFQELEKMYLHDTHIVGCKEGSSSFLLAIESPFHDSCELVFNNTKQVTSTYSIDENIIKQCEINLLKDGLVEFQIISDVLFIENEFEGINEITIIASDVEINRLNN